MADSGEPILEPTALTDSAGTLIYTEAAKSHILNVHVANTDPTKDALLFLCKGGTTEAAAWFWRTLIRKNGGTLDWQTFKVLNTGQTLYAWSDQPGILTLSIDGAVIT